MPLPALLGSALIGAGGQALGGLADYFTTRDANYQSRKFAREMYGRQKADSIEFWNLQNEYNSPQRQMERLRAAGLSPNLAYDQGGFNTPASSPAVPNPQGADFRPSRVGDFISGAGSQIANYMDFEIKQAQYDNILAQTTATLEEALLKASNRRNVDQNTERSLFDLGLDRELRDTTAEFRRESVRRLKAEISSTLSENERRTAMQSVNIFEAAERILNMRAERARTGEDSKRIRAATSGLRKDNVLKDLDIELRKNGIMQSDPLWSRVLGRYLDNLLSADWSGVKQKAGESIRKGGQSYLDWLKGGGVFGTIGKYFFNK